MTPIGLALRHGLVAITFLGFARGCCSGHHVAMVGMEHGRFVVPSDLQPPRADLAVFIDEELGTLRIEYDANGTTVIVDYEVTERIPPNER